MRDFKNMKRQRGRNRGGGGGGGGKPQQNANRAFDSNGPDNVKIRGHAQHVFEKYQQLARDSFSSGDRVLAENYLQHADHYFRVLRTIQPQRPPSEILGRDVLASGLDIDFEEEFEPSDEIAEAPGDQGSDAGAQGDARNDGQRRDGSERDGRRDEGRRDEGRYDNRRDGAYRDRPEARQDSRQDTRQDRGGDYRQDRGEPRQDRADYRQDRGEPRQDRYEGRRDNRPYEGRRDERSNGRDNRDYRSDERRPDDRQGEERSEDRVNDPLAVVAPQAAQPFPASTTEAQPSPLLRSEDGAMSEAPAFLHGGATSGEADGERRPRTRRRRTPRTFENPEGGQAEPQTEDA